MIILKIIKSNKKQIVLRLKMMIYKQIKIINKMMNKLILTMIGLSFKIIKNLQSRIQKQINLKAINKIIVAKSQILYNNQIMKMVLMNLKKRHLYKILIIMTNKHLRLKPKISNKKDRLMMMILMSLKMLNHQLRYRMNNKCNNKRSNRFKQILMIIQKKILIMIWQY